jgi:hypothetical protein
LRGFSQGQLTLVGTLTLMLSISIDTLSGAIGL